MTQEIYFKNTQAVLWCCNALNFHKNETRLFHDNPNDLFKLPVKAAGEKINDSVLVLFREPHITKITLVFILRSLKAIWNIFLEKKKKRLAVDVERAIQFGDDFLETDLFAF